MIPKELQNMKPLSGDESLPRDADYMGAIDIDEGSEPILTINHLYNGEITLSKGKEKKKVITFVEEKANGINEVRPLVLNRANWKMLKKLFGQVTPKALEGKKIQLYLQDGVRNPSTGEKGKGIRIRDKAPTGAKYVAPKCEGCGKAITGMANFTAEQIAAASKQKYGKCLCVECGQKAKAELEAANAVKTEEPATAEPENDLAAQLMAAAEE